MEQRAENIDEDKYGESFEYEGEVGGTFGKSGR